MSRVVKEFRLYIAGVLAGWSAVIGGQHLSIEVLQCYHKLFVAMRDQP